MMSGSLLDSGVGLNEWNFFQETEKMLGAVNYFIACFCIRVVDNELNSLNTISLPNSASLVSWIKIRN